jgi:hypothetical protein
MAPCRDAFGRDYPVEHMFSCVGEGWHSLILGAYKTCEEYGVDIYDVKEKYGGLRIEIGPAPEEVHEIIEKVEEVSHYTCDTCGGPALTHEERFWILTRCDDCIAKQKAKKEQDNGC